MWTRIEDSLERCEYITRVAISLRLFERNFANAFYIRAASINTQYLSRCGEANLPLKGSFSALRSHAPLVSPLNCAFSAHAQIS